MFSLQVYCFQFSTWLKPFWIYILAVLGNHRDYDLDNAKNFWQYINIWRGTSGPKRLLFLFLLSSMIGSMFVIQFPYKNRTSGEESQNMRVFYISGRLTFFNLYSTFRHHINQVGDCFSAEATRKMNIYIYIYLVGGGGRDEVWDRETMFSQLAKRSPCVVVSG